MFTLETVQFDRWPASLRLSNGEADLVVPTQIGPRVMRYGFTGGRNLFKIFPPNPADTRIRGGHRVWVAPERLETTWINDDLWIAWTGAVGYPPGRTRPRTDEAKGYSVTPQTAICNGARK